MRRNPAGTTVPALFAAAMILAGCAGTPSQPGYDAAAAATAAQDSGAVISDVGTPRERARAHTELAAAYYQRGSLGVALQEARVALVSDSRYAPAYNVLGLVHMDLREYPQAESAFKRSLELDPTDPDANHNFGWFLCRTDRPDESIRYFLAAVRNPLYATPQKSYELAASCSLKKNKEKEALDFLDKALRFDPNYLPALMSAAQLHYRRGELEDAKKLVARFNKLIDPTAQSLWLALRIERKLGDRSAESSFASQLRRRFAGSHEYNLMREGHFE